MDPIFFASLMPLAVTPTGKELVKRACNAIGHIALPLVGVYKAQVEAYQRQIETVSEGKKTIEAAKVEKIVEEIKGDTGFIVNEKLLRVTANRLVAEEVKKQINMENILAQVLPLLNEKTARPQDVDEDLLNDFLNRFKNVSNLDLQKYWAKLLAQEVNNPNSVSKKTLNVLSNMGKYDAELFEKLSSLVITIDGDPYLLHSLINLSLDDIYYLDEIGLVHKPSGVICSGAKENPPLVKIEYNCNYIGVFKWTHQSHRVESLTKVGKDIYFISAKTINNPKVEDYLLHKNEYADKPHTKGFNPPDHREFSFVEENKK